jgi:thiamine-phosphate pyrophosphorylase
MNVLHDVDIYGITGEEFSRGRNNITVVQEMIRAGIRLIQYREKEKHMGQKFEECLTIRRLTQDAGVCFKIGRAHV